MSLKKKAWAMFKAGKTVKQVAEAMGVQLHTAEKWDTALARAWHGGGSSSTKSKTAEEAYDKAQKRHPQASVFYIGRKPYGDVPRKERQRGMALAQGVIRKRSRAWVAKRESKLQARYPGMTKAQRQKAYVKSQAAKRKSG